MVEGHRMVEFSKVDDIVVLRTLDAIIIHLWVFVDRKVNIAFPDNIVASKFVQRATNSLFNVFLQGWGHINVVSGHYQSDASFSLCEHLKGDTIMVLNVMDVGEGGRQKGEQ
jgi:hypothetical protein